MEVTTVVARVSPPLFIFLVRFPSSFLHSSLPTFFFSPSFTPSSFLVFLVVVFVVVVSVTVDPLFFLFTMHRSTGTLPPCQQTNAGKKRRKRWKRTTGFFHTQTSASSSSQTARLFLASVTELQSRRRNEAIVKIHCELWPDFIYSKILALHDDGHAPFHQEWIFFDYVLVSFFFLRHYE